MIQIDLPMPEACDVCPLNYDFCGCQAMNDKEWEKYGDDWNLQVCDGERRPEYCPLKEVKEGKEPKQALFRPLPFNDYRFECPRCMNSVEMFQCGEQTSFCPFCGQAITF